MRAVVRPGTRGLATALAALGAVLLAAAGLLVGPGLVQAGPVLPSPDWLLAAPGLVHAGLLLVGPWLLFAAPLLVVALVLAGRRYPGERRLLALARARRRAPRGTDVRVPPRRRAPLRSVRGGRLIGRALAQRGPPALLSA